MKICLAQTRPIKGDIQANIDNHQKLIDLAAVYRADIIVFPELSLTAYEPTLAHKLATTPDDVRLQVFQTISDEKQMIIAVGLPTRNQAGIYISMLIFQPEQPQQVYSKKYLHVDEEPWFVSGPNFPILPFSGMQIAPAICYELSIPEHARTAVANGANLYLASVAKSADGVKAAHKRLAEIAATYAMPVLMVNCVGPSDDFVSAGQSAVWNAPGHLLGQLNDSSEGLLIFDTVSGKLIVHQ